MLNVKKIESFEAAEKAYKKSDSQGLFLFVTPSGAKLWRLAYRFAGKQKELSLGQYPEITLAKARDKRDDARRLIANGADPGQAKQETKRALAAARSFADWADEWMGKQEGPRLSEKTLVGKRRLVGYLKEEFGKRAMADIKRSDVIVYLRDYETEGTLETRDRVRAAGEMIFEYSDLDGTGINPFRKIDAQLLKNSSTPRPAFIKEKDARGLFRKMAEPFERGLYSNIVGLALQFISLTVVRPGEIASAEWSDFDLDGAIWTVPAAKMKMDKEHIVPLSRQALAIISQVKSLTGDRSYVFSCRSDKPIHNITLCRRMRDLGYDTAKEHCPHGFRSTFSTLLNAEVDADENKRWDANLIELQLAHLDESSVKAVYNRTGPMSLYTPRARLMQHWADRIDTMVADNVIQLVRGAA